MPARPARPCPAPRCPNMVPCQIHKKKYDRTYGPRLYDSMAWIRIRDLQLSMEPLCRECAAKGLTVAAIDVDHIVRLVDGGARLDQANLQSLCRACHGRKSRAEQLVSY